ncbi:MAG: IclR family transcriptional regulator [Pseudonocardiaceae bacterium]
MNPVTLPPQRPAEPTDLIRSVSRALRVLEEVGRARRPLPVKVIARRAELNLSTAYHLVRTLCFEGYLVRIPSGDYAIGPGLAERFHDLVRALHRPPRAHTVLQHLAECTGHTAYLARFVDGQLVIADVVEGPRSPYLEDLQVGLEAAAHATALGKALLGTLPASLRRRQLAELEMRPFTANTPTEPAHVEAELREMRPGDVVVEHGQFRADVCCAGAAVPSHGTVERWAVGLSSRGQDLPGPILHHLRLAVLDLDPAPR